MNGRVTILVIDDDPLLVAMIEHKLKTRGYNVDIAADGVAGLSHAREKRPDVIVLDVMMPSLDGRQLLQTLKADPQLSSVPVIMLTARRGESDIVSALQLGATDYLTKPFSTDELMARITRLLPKTRDAAS
jgi:two-component system alkaline phosphatase synthesis response regulator PhoP